MLLEVRDVEGKFLGKIMLRPGQEPEILELAAAAFSHFVEVCWQEGITDLREIYDEQTRSYTLMEIEVKQNDPLYPLAFRDFLGRAGFTVHELHLELETEIRQLLAKFSDDNFDKKDILSRLPSMPYREQTFLVRKLKELEG
ncbi:MAG: hypothetical protein Q8N81_02355 [bacterium]|nr:hypothetical protein [bacterium]